MVKIFISYRRADSRKDAARIYDRLVEAFGKENIFKDVDNIPIGSDFRGVLREAVAACDVQLVVIGRQWLDITDENGKRRLDNPIDFVRIEVESALQRDRCLVVPVLVDHATMPAADRLPLDLRELAFKNATVVRDDPDFHHDVTRIIDALRQRYGENSSTSVPRSTVTPTKPFDVRAAIKEFYAAFDEQNWEHARELLTEVRTSGRAPSFFDVDTHERELWDAIEASENEAKRDEEYDLLRLMMSRLNKGQAWKALQQFWQSYPKYDPADLATLVRPEIRPLGILTNHTASVEGALELADGRILSWSANNILRLWHRHGKALQILEGHTDNINGALELSNEYLLSWSVDNTLRLWNRYGKALQILEGHTDRVNGALELSNGRLLSWSHDSTLRLWDREGRVRHVMEGHTGRVGGGLELTDSRLLSRSADGTLRLWDRQGKPLQVLEGHDKWIEGALELKDGRLLSWSDDTTLRLWDRRGNLLYTLEGHTANVRGALELTDGRLLSWSNDKTLLLEANGRLASRSLDNTLRLWDRQGKVLQVLEGHLSGVLGGMELPDGRLLSWSKDGTLRLWDPQGRVQQVLEGHTGWINGALEFYDGRILSWSEDGTLRLWDLQGRVQQVLEGHTGWINGALEFYDGRILSWSGDHTLRIWGIPD
jgi:WD40 repeat protein